MEKTLCEVVQNVLAGATLLSNASADFLDRNEEEIRNIEFDIEDLTNDLG